MFKDFIIKKMMEKQLKGISKEDQEKLINLVRNNPEFFNKIAEEVKIKTNSGINAKLATMDVMKKYQNELQQINK